MYAHGSFQEVIKDGSMIQKVLHLVRPSTQRWLLGRMQLRIDIAYTPSAQLGHSISLGHIVVIIGSLQLVKNYGN